MQDSPIKEGIARRLAAIQSRIDTACRKVGRDAASVKLVAVTKNRSHEEIEALYALGLRNFAENRVQELRRRQPEHNAAIRWDLIGHLQTNKAKYLPGIVSCVHSVDGIDVAQALQKAWEKNPYIPRLDVLIQVNIAAEEQKFGCEPSDVPAIIETIKQSDRLNLIGLMTMAPFFDEPELARPVFRALRELRDQLQTQQGIALPDLSMGMSGDYEVAIEEGATIVRIGTALFED